MQYTQTDWPVQPMEPAQRLAPFDSDDTIFQVKWDGVRILSYIYPDGSIRLFNRKLNERTVQYPEIIGTLANIPAGTVLDGEMVALDENGKPDFPGVLRRDLIRSATKIKLLINSVPVHYMVFDALWLGGEAIHALPLSERQKLLLGLDFPSGRIQKADSIAGKGTALFEAVKREGLEGIVAKQTASPYLIGKKTDLWQKIKCFRTVTAVAGGYTQEETGRIRSLLVGVQEEHELVYTGAAASGITQKQWGMLRELFAEIPGPCPFGNAPDIPGAQWVLPMLKVQVRFLEYTAEGIMRAPSVLGFVEA